MAEHKLVEISEMAEQKLIEQALVSPSTPRTTTTSLPLTFLDLPFAGPVYVERLFFYHFPHSTTHFCKTTLPSLKHSLSLTLQHFFPLAGNLQCPPQPHKPFILCTQNDSVAFTIVESSADFNHLSTNHHPKNLKDYNYLSPKLSRKTTYDGNDIENNTFIFPLLSLQASVFPNHGLCIAITYCHVMDDSCCSHFMKSWSFIHRNCEVVDLKSTPCFDRNFLRDPKGLENVFLRDYFEERKTWKDKLIGQTQSQTSEEEYVKATIVFAKEEIERMKIWALDQWKKNDCEVQAPQFLSKFVVTCGFIWASMVKTRCRKENDNDDDEKEEYFGFPGDCRERLGYKIPEGYFGNCLTLCHATMKRKDMKGEDGYVNAVKVIERVISEMKNEPFKDMGEWRDRFKKMYELGSVLLVTGSPKFNVYETDFGFGKPAKVEMVHPFTCMSIAESENREGGLEVGLVFKSEDFKYFSSIIEQGLQALKF
ncbi:putative transferase [Medicago truncatula]|uniref:HXXXD-type acyl-transferase family protein n=1 Tax=Medicago truncatula TaxID=3880 RepID=A0A072VC64_MEDTR|nr:malonyl-coenzyme A:anthocyanin 3-O-glucoside-6''-O-malonyltransferase [Medicago truncatula]KEH39033.1 HXXXD-type acyl-transferase family protein [Medicago truncatula]RHN75645.1 putative transferase [Medicago truncatula]